MFDVRRAVQIRCQPTNDGGVAGFASGYAIGHGLVLTCAHVLPEGAAHCLLSVRDAFLTEAAGDVVWENRVDDVALIRVSDPTWISLPLARLGTLPTSIEDVKVRFIMFGWPRAGDIVPPTTRNEAASHKLRDGVQVDGLIKLAEMVHSRSGTVRLRPDDKHPPIAEGTFWQGLSGAAIVCGGFVVGVQLTQPQSQLTSYLAARHLTSEVLEQRDTKGRSATEILAAAGFPVLRILDLAALGGSAGTLTRSGYSDYIRRRVPAGGLLDRDAELDELAEFCASDEAYVWWQASPWAGKSALLSTFVLNPPDGVDVLAFFVDAADVSQADSDAFDAVQIAQLMALLSEPLAQPDPHPLARDSYRRGLLESAARRAHAAGRQLLLVVDALDEDIGAVPGSRRASICSRLPMTPAKGLKVIVSSRPDRPMPMDVSSGHPLRTCRVRVLDESPHALEIATKARHELDALLNDELASREVVGKLAAAGGGLSTTDILDLTGLAPYELERMLAGVFGRTIARLPASVSQPGAGDEVLLFTHAGLMSQAQQRLGQRLMRSYRDQVHTWADGYRARRWPPGTPAYLLRTYPLMLREQQESDRVDSLILDPDYLIRVETRHMLAVLDHATSAALPMAQLYRSVAHDLERSDATIRAALLHSAAMRTAPMLVPSLSFSVRQAWRTLWTDSLMTTHQTLVGQRLANVLAAVVTPDGRTVLAAGGEGGISLWNAATGIDEGHLPGHTNGPVTSLAFCVIDDRVLLASSGYDNLVRVWDIGSGAQVAELAGHSKCAKGLVWVPAPEAASPYLVSAGADGTMRWWDTMSGEALRVIDANQGDLNALTTVRVADKLLLVSAGDSRDIRLWDAGSGADNGKLTGHTNSLLALATYRRSDGQVILASSSDDSTLRLWDIASRTETSKIELSSIGPLALLMLADGRSGFATTYNWGDSSHQIRVHELGGALVTTLDGHAGSVEALIAVSLPDGRTLLASASFDDTVRLWDLTNPSQFGPPSAQVRIDVPVAMGGLPSGSSSLIDGGRTGSLRSRDALTGTTLWTRVAHEARDGAVMHPDLLGGTLDTGSTHDGPVRSVFLTTMRDNKQVLVTVSAAGGEQGIRTWNPVTGEPLASYPSDNPGFCTKPAFFVDGAGRHIMATNGGDLIRAPLKLRMLNVDTGKQWISSWGDGSPLTAICAATLINGDVTVALGDFGGAIRLWNVTEDTFDIRVVIPTLFYGVHDLEFVHLSDGRTWLIASSDAIYVWDLSTGELVHQLGKDHRGVVGLTITQLADGRALLISGSMNGPVRIWDLVGGGLILTLPMGDIVPHVAAHGALLALSASRGMSVIDISASLPNRFDHSITVRPSPHTMEIDDNLERIAEAGDIHAAARLAALLRRKKDTGRAKDWLLRAARGGNAEAMYLVGVDCAEREETAAAAAWWQLAADHGSVHAARQLAVALFNQGEYTEAGRYARVAADSAHVTAIYLLGLLAIQQGDNQEAEKWFRAAKRGGHVDSKYRLGLLLDARGETHEAKRILTFAARSGHGPAAAELGSLYARTNDMNDAEYWYRTAAEANDPHGCVIYAQICQQRGAPVEAHRWLRKSAEARYPLGAYLFAKSLLALKSGTGELDRRETDAGTWMHRAAEAGETAAMRWLADTYRHADELTRAEQWLTTAAEAGDAEAMFQLAIYFTQDDEDHGAAASWMSRAAEVGYPHAETFLGTWHFLRGDVEQADQHYRQAAEGGDAVGMANLAMVLQQTDPEQAAAWATRAAKLGIHDSWNLLATLALSQGRLDDAIGYWEQGTRAGNATSAESLIKLYKLQARDGDVAAMLRLGALIANHDGQAAQGWLELAATAGDPDAMVMLGTQHNADDPATAQAWVQKAADLGSTNAMLQLAARLLPSEPGKALDWYQRAAVAGDLDAMVTFGALTYTDDPAVARNWWRRAANAGNANAMFNLGVADIGHDPAGANRWFVRAASHGEPDLIRAIAQVLNGTDAKQARMWLQEAADNGDTHAAFDIAHLMEQSDNIDAAIHWYRKAAQNGHADAAIRLGTLLWFSKGDPAGRQWLERAAHEHRPDAMATLANAWSDSDPDLAQYWRERATEADSVEAE